MLPSRFLSQENDAQFLKLKYANQLICAGLDTPSADCGTGEYLKETAAFANVRESTSSSLFSLINKSELITTQTLIFIKD
jgi:hypothetical protein